VTVASWIVYAVGVALDVWSTRAAIKSGRGQEGHPLYRLARGRWLLVRLAVAAAFAVATVLWVAEPTASHGRLGAGALLCAVAAWNFHVAGKGD
jgi:hypothetical protein